MRDRIRGAALAAAALTLSFVACQTPGSPDGERGRAEIPSSASPVETETLLETTQSGIEERQRAVFEDASAFGAWWSEVSAGAAPEPEPPEVDFGQRTVVAAAMGRRPTGGHAIEIAEVRRDGEELWVVVRETSPSRDCMVTQALTAPVTAASVPRVSGEVHFAEVEETRDC